MTTVSKMIKLRKMNMLLTIIIMSTMTTMTTITMVPICLAPRPHYSVQPKRFGSYGPSENVRAFPARSPRIRHLSELTESDWENAVRGLGKVPMTKKAQDD